MSRIGKLPITVPKGVKVNVEGRRIVVQGAKATLHYDVPEEVSFAVAGDQITFTRSSDDRRVRSLHGTARAVTANLVRGCSTGFTREMQIIGVGYRAQAKGRELELALGYSHPINFKLPEGVAAEVTKDGKLVLTGANRRSVGQTAADIRAYRAPEPYKGKGVRYSDERVVQKEGKARAKA